MFERTPQDPRKDISAASPRCSFFKAEVPGSINAFFHFVWPQRCPVCGKIGVSCCDRCLRSAASPLPPFCAKCGAPFGAGCCSGSVPCYALSLHEGISRDLLLDLKYKNVRSLGIPMGRLMGETFSAVRTDMLIPIPLHRSGRREYNQSLLLAEGVSLVWGIPAEGRMLIWRKNVDSQAGKTGPSRNMMAPDAMEASKSLDGMSVVLVDDVYTTGNTMRAAISAVERSGGTVSSVLVWSGRVPSQENEAAWKDIGIQTGRGAGGSE
ncbi:ComF family protein [Caenicola nitritireducens]|uniref:ComF family protein n=1 Tax=Caenicola nitritireducens TaxID=2006111 RepID=UPI003C7A93E4|nr:phosphoribosyltransferase family protein [Synergistaceae bacterium DZ-S4]